MGSLSPKEQISPLFRSAGYGREKGGEQWHCVIWLGWSRGGWTATFCNLLSPGKRCQSSGGNKQTTAPSFKLQYEGAPHPTLCSVPHCGDHQGKASSVSGLWWGVVKQNGGGAAVCEETLATGPLARPWSQATPTHPDFTPFLKPGSTLGTEGTSRSVSIFALGLDFASLTPGWAEEHAGQHLWASRSGGGGRRAGGRSRGGACLLVTPHSASPLMVLLRLLPFSSGNSPLP